MVTLIGFSNRRILFSGQSALPLGCGECPALKTRVDSFGEAPEAAGWWRTGARAVELFRKLSATSFLGYLQRDKMALTQESVLSFLLERGGKVKNSELLSNFKSRISCSDPAEKQHKRDLFKKLVNSVAVVKQIDDVKFVVVKKRYQDFAKELPPDVSRKAQMDDSFSSLNASFSSTSPLRAQPAGGLRSDGGNKAACSPSRTAHCHGDEERARMDGVQKRRPDPDRDATTVKVLNISGVQTNPGKSGAVFALIAVKSPPRDSAPAPRGGLLSQGHQRETSDEPLTKVSPLPLLSSSFSARKGDLLKEPQSWKTRQKEGVQPPAGPQIKTTRQADDGRFSESVPLEPLAHEWLVKCAAGLWGQIHTLLLRDTRLAQRKDFMSGFTALHWAAKDGNSSMIHKLLDISRKRGTSVNVNCKAHGGYTPLHIAAIHGHTEAVVLLVQRYGANVNERDNYGKKAFHYLGKGVTAEVRALLGGPLQRSGTAEEEEHKEHGKGFNSISKLFHPHVGKKQKTTIKFHEW
ncbi:unnamed protein product [Menidia menidia]|uniref:(Atlantic silverside) hypothetical protein n=1 Tax=Menidia menidia TaxID=238744 RepID=A0A8S4BTY6_9TELE|nr:unnamed protein product [Menidia menidia]